MMSKPNRFAAVEIAACVVTAVVWSSAQAQTTSPSAATEGPRVATPATPMLEGPRVSTSPTAAAASEASVGAAAAEPSRPQSPAASAGPQPTTRRGGTDRLDLDTTVVTGNRELPKVLYIVPWKKADIGELPAQPFNTLLDEALAPVDRDVFRREVTYYGAVATSLGASSAAAGGSEK